MLVAQGDAYIIDFEGEPARAARGAPRARRRPLRDVAGLLRSLDYAAAVAAALGAARRRLGAARSGAAPCSQRCAGASAARLLDAYRADASSRRRTSLGAAEAARPLLDLFLLEKAAYEVLYEAANRPTWLAMPLRGLAGMSGAWPGDHRG